MTGFRLPAAQAIAPRAAPTCGRRGRMLYVGEGRVRGMHFYGKKYGIDRFGLWRTARLAKSLLKSVRQLPLPAPGVRRQAGEKADLSCWIVRTGYNRCPRSSTDRMRRRFDPNTGSDLFRISFKSPSLPTEITGSEVDSGTFRHNMEDPWSRFPCTMLSLPGLRGC
jgi:hypothetical protein